jgi:Tfp pilus assembly protein PilE
MKGSRGYLVIMLMMAVFVLTLGLLIAVPVWQTELQREKEEELIFRGKQYAEAVRIFVQKNPSS